MSFIEFLSQKIINNISVNQKIMVVLPNQRARQHLLLEMSGRIQQPVFAPTIVTMDELVQSLSPLTLADSSRQLIELFRVYRECDFRNDDSFLTFMNWSRTFLKDIDEIDQYSGDARLIFSNLADLKELDFFGQEQLSENQRKYLDFYQHLNDLYLRFRNHLMDQQLGYNGMIYRDVAENAERYLKDFVYDRVIFGGLLALAPTEQQLVRAFRQRTQVDFFFDLDKFYYDNDKLGIHSMVQEVAASTQIAKIEQVGDNYREISKKVVITGASQAMGQVYAAVQVLNAMTPEQLEHTAVVLADESLLMPFIHAYGQENCNVTMRYPARHTHAFHLFHDLMSAAQNYRRLNHLDENGQPQSGSGYYHKDILALLGNPVLARTVFSAGHLAQEAIDGVVQLNKVFLTLEDLGEVLHFDFPDLAKEGRDFLSAIIAFLQEIIQKFDNEKESIDREVLRLLVQELQKVDELAAGFQDFTLDFRTLTTFVNEQVGTLGLPFVSNPNKGLQVMGILETRMLDFDNIIMLSVNEGTIPAGKSTDSMLLFVVKKHFGLPTYEHQDTAYAYHFFRLLQRASSIHIIYNTDTSTSANEESRFVRQLEYEIKHQHLTDGISVERRQVSVQPKLSMDSHHIAISKTQSDIDKLLKMDFSVSTLSIFINCPLQFYLTKLANVDVPMAIDENIEQNVVGNVVHNVLEQVAKDIIDAPSQCEPIIQKYQSLIQNKPAFLQEYFWENDAVKGQDLSRGKLFIAVEVVKRQLKRYLEVWLKELSDPVKPVEVVAPELRLEYDFPVDEWTFKMKGFADLVEKREDKTAILDYKTGRIYELNYPGMEIAFSNPEYHQLLQLLTYAYLYWKTKGVKPEDITCALVSFQSLMSGNEILHGPTQAKASGRGKEPLPITTELLEEYEAELCKLFQRIMDRNTKFEQAEDAAHCEWCDYRSVCGR
jgi:CRISPR/Cas system-associated exonuclease Cas4 (RecB family)